MNNIYVLHEYGAKSHYLALSYLASTNQYEIKYRNFQYLLTLNAKSIYNIIKHPIQSIIDICFLLTLPIRKASKIVIGIAPYNKNLRVLMRLLKKHEVYFHTSYDCWDGSRYAYKPENERTLNDWKFFTTQYVKHIFAVSEYTKKQLVNNGFAGVKNISVVKHSYTEKIKPEIHKKKELTFICVGRLINEKGILELLDIFSRNKNLNILFVGDGYLKDNVKAYSCKYSNIKYYGYAKNFKELISLYQNNCFLLLNSHKTKNWQELFGMVIIEGMTCGCVPITTDHIGPKEIITQNDNGIICEEGSIIKGINKVVEMSDLDYQEMRIKAIKEGEKYYYKTIARRWNPVFCLPENCM